MGLLYLFYLDVRGQLDTAVALRHADTEPGATEWDGWVGVTSGLGALEKRRTSYTCRETNQGFSTVHPVVTLLTTLAEFSGLLESNENPNF